MRYEDVRTSDLINPTARQRECINATDKHRYVLYGGGGGGGKSYLLRWWLVRQLIRRHRKTGIKKLNAGLFSIDFPTLQQRQISKMEREFPPWLGVTKRTEKEGLCFFMNEDFGGGRISLCNLADANSYKSAEFCDIAIEELSENKRDVFEDLVLFRLRFPGIDRPCFLGGTNPTGIGVQWIKALWIDRKFPAELKHLEKEFAFVPALLGDNPHLDQSYEETLRGLPEKKRRALLYGDWTVPEGQYFTNFERSERKVHPSVVARIVKPWWNCLAAGTLVATERGDVPIERIRAGERVWTRKGLKKVVRSWASGSDKDVLEAEFSDGRKLIATPDHKILANGVFTALDEMSMGDRIELWNPSTSTATSTLSIKTGITDQFRLPCTAISGSFITDPSRPATIFTTKMGTERITTSRTLNCSEFQSMSAWLAGESQELQRSSQRCWRERRSGEKPLLGKNTFVYSERCPDGHRKSTKLSAANADRLHGLLLKQTFALPLAISGGEGKTARITSRRTAPPAESNSSPTRPITSGPAERDADKNGVFLKNLKPHGKSNVYDLAIEDEHEFYANGILVHNCWVSQDWGFKHHTPVHWHAVGMVSPEDAKLMGRTWDVPKRCVFTYREHIESLGESGRSELELGKTIRVKSAKEDISRWILSRDAFGEKSSMNTPAQLLSFGADTGRDFPHPVPANMGPGSRPPGWRFMYNLIQNDEWFISELCPEALSAIPSLEYDADDGGEDILKTDHLYDDIGDCFTADTPVATEVGWKAISRIRPGLRVWTREGLKPVRHVWSKGIKEIVKATFSDGRTIRATPRHRFWSGDRFLPLDELRRDDNPYTWEQFGSMRPAFGNALRLTGLESAGKAKVWDLEVEGCHEFFAGGVLAHNCLRYGLIDMLGDAKVPHSVALAERIAAAPDELDRWLIREGERRRQMEREKPQNWWE
jgi:hypothetical protein